jgi:predicted GTPase
VTNEEYEALIDIVGRLQEENTNLKEHLYNLHAHHQEQADEITETVDGLMDMFAVVLSENAIDVDAVAEIAGKRALTANSLDWSEGLPDGANATANRATVSAQIRTEQGRLRGEQRVKAYEQYLNFAARSPYWKQD